jgi:hypothetical protein
MSQDPLDFIPLDPEHDDKIAYAGHGYSVIDQLTVADWNEIYAYSMGFVNSWDCSLPQNAEQIGVHRFSWEPQYELQTHAGTWEGWSCEANHGTSNLVNILPHHLGLTPSLNYTINPEYFGDPVIIAGEHLVIVEYGSTLGYEKVGEG